MNLRNCINGELAAPASGAMLDVTEPATGEVYARVPDSDASDVDRAVQSARKAFPAWAASPAHERSRLLNRLADLIERDHEALARAEAVDTGKPITLARKVDIARSIANLRFFAGAILHTQSGFHETNQGAGRRAINYTLRRPRGVAGLISPWNLPLYLLTWKIAPAIATGNTAVAKPSELTPMTAFLFSQLTIEAGLLPGVINIVHGVGGRTGAAIVQHPDVPTISFTGSTAVGRWIAHEAGDRLKRVSLELGGKNPTIIFADADLDRAIEESARAAFTNQGQVCLCGSRVLVERSAYERVVDGLVRHAQALRIGDPLDESTTFGSLVSGSHKEKVASGVQAARDAGGVIRCGGDAPKDLPARCRDGFFYAPTVITNVPRDCAADREEIFGPVVTIRPFDTDDEAIALANDTPYGLAASIWTSNLARAHALAERVEAGIIWVNCWMLRDLRTPFGGTKQSGVGREGGEEALRFFTEPKNVCIPLPEEH